MYVKKILRNKICERSITKTKQNKTKVNQAGNDSKTTGKNEEHGSWKTGDSVAVWNRMYQRGR